MHTVSGLIRRAPRIQQGQNNNGPYTMFMFELSEYIKDRNGGEPTYTNYSVVLFAKTPGAIDFHNKAIAEGNFVVVNCDKLKINLDNQQYPKLQMENPNLSDFAVIGGQAGGQQQAQQQSYGNAPQQQSQQQAPQQQAQPQGYGGQQQSGVNAQQPNPQAQQQRPPQQNQAPQQQAQHNDPSMGFDDTIPF